MTSEDDRDSRHHTWKLQASLQETIKHLRRGIEKVDEVQLKAMFETAAEVPRARSRPNWPRKGT